MSIQNDCPVELRPNANQECVGIYSYKFKTMNGLDCCRKPSSPLKKAAASWIKVIKLRHKQPKRMFRDLNGQESLQQIQDVFNIYGRIRINFDKEVMSVYGTPRQSEIELRQQMEEQNLIKEGILTSCQIPRSITLPLHRSEQGYVTMWSFLMSRFNLNMEFRKCDDILKYIPETQWIIDQFKYQLNLGSEAQAIIILYSYQGDTLINGFLRNESKVTLDLLHYVQNNLETFETTLETYLGYPVEQELTLSIIQDYCSYLVTSMNLIISKSPPTINKFVVFRGVTDISYMIGTGDIYANKGFVSTSLDARTSLNFGGDQGYMNYIQIPVGYHCLYNNLAELNFPEYEIILPNDSKYEVLGKFQNKDWIMTEDDRNRSYDPTDFILTTQMTNIISMI